MSKIDLLEKEANKIQTCRECKKGKTGEAVPGEGNPDAKIFFVGEAPGREEAKTGKPFVGRSGRFLTEFLLQIGIKREDVFITSPVKYYPRRRALTDSEIAHSTGHLLRQIEIVNPKIIVLLGNVAARALLTKSVKISGNHGEVIRENNRTYFLTFHPAAAIRFPKIKKQMGDDFKKLKRLIYQMEILKGNA